MRKKAIMAAVIITTFFVSLVAGIYVANLAKANFIAYCPVFVINSDGIITPPTTLIERKGDSYYLSSDTSNCSFVINCSNIVFDGQGFTISGKIGRFHGYLNTGLVLTVVQNVTIKDVTFSDFRGGSIILRNCSNCVLYRVHADGYVSMGYSCLNTISQSSLSELILGGYSTNNLVTRNQLEALVTTGDHNTICENNVTKLYPYDGCYNLIYGNNFYTNDRWNYMNANFWNNESIGNFWLDYTTRYPNATEIGNTGIGNTPYLIDENNTDYYPLMYPSKVSIPNSTPSLNPTVTLTPTPIPSPSPTPSSSPTIEPTLEPIQTPSHSPTLSPSSSEQETLEPNPSLDINQNTNFTPVVILSVILVVTAVTVGVIVYFMKYHGKK